MSAPVKALFSVGDQPLGIEAQRALDMFGELGSRLNEHLEATDGLPSVEWSQLAAVYSKVVLGLLREARGYHAIKVEEDRAGSRMLSPAEESRALVDAAATLISAEEFEEVCRRRGIKR